MMIMDRNGMLSCPLGVYRVHWSEEGGTSLASIGQLYNGDRWMAPANWTNQETNGVVVELSKYVSQIDALELLADTRTEYERKNESNHTRSNS